MITPGSNLVAQALTLIASQKVGYIRFLNRITAPNGDLVPTFAPPVPRTGSFQAVTKEYMILRGLDENKEYAFWFDPRGETRSLDRDIGSDRISFKGFLWEAVTDTDWKEQDGWKGVLFVNLKVVPTP